jgi:hypothetical protein
VASVQPVIDPAAVWLVRDWRGIPQVGELGFGAGDGVEDFGQRHVPAADGSQVAVRTVRSDRPV